MPALINTMAAFNNLGDNSIFGCVSVSALEKRELRQIKPPCLTVSAEDGAIFGSLAEIEPQE